MMNLSLTDYTDFSRNLEFQYMKAKDLNNELQIQNEQFQKMYEKASLQLFQSQEKLAATESQLNECQNSIISIVSPFTQQSFSSFNHAINQLNVILNNAKELQYKNQKKQKQWTFREQNLAQKIGEMQEDLKNLQSMRLELHAENTVLVKENEQLMMQVASYKFIAEEAKSKGGEKQTLEGEEVRDQAFAIDLLTYEKEYLKRVLINMIESLQNEELKVNCKRIYQICEQILSQYREKLQLEYDLEDLELQYKKERKNQEEKVMICLRKQIQSFRKELTSHKELLTRLETKLHEKFHNLKSQQFQEQKLRNMTVDMQSKLRRSNELELKRTANTDDMVKDMIERDRENMEKILYETRSLFKK